MKKALVFGIIFAMLISFSAFSAGQGEDSTEDTMNENPDFIRVGTASLGGNFFPMGTAISVVVEQKVEGVQSSAQATGGSAFNMNAIQEGELEMAIAQGTAVAAGVFGTGSFEGHKTEDVRTIANYNATPQHILISADAGIDNVNELTGMKLEMIGSGDGVEVSTKKILKALGISWEEIDPAYSGNRVQAASRLKTGQVDGIIDGTGVGSSWLVDVIGDGRFKLLSLTDDQIEKITDKYPEFSPVTIPAGTYKGQTEDVTTVSNWTVILCHKNLSDSLVNDITKALFDNTRYLRNQHSYFNDMAPENIVGAVIAPLHPGAENYYKEIGVLD